MENKNYNFIKLQNLAQGENPHQKASLYKIEEETLDWQLLQGPEMNYNDILNSSCAIEIANEFFDVYGVVVVKHNNPCAVALAKDLPNALDKILDCNPIDFFNSTITFTKEVDYDTVKKIKDLQIEVLIAPSYSKEALEILSKNKSIKVIQLNTPLREIARFYKEEIKLTPFGALIQEKDTKDLDVSTFKVVTKKKPQQSELEDMIFAFKIAKHTKSSCAVVAKDLRTVGISNGEADSAKAIEVAIAKVCDSPKDCIVALDKPIESVTSIQIAVQQRISAIISSLGNVNDNNIIDFANKYEISVVSTGIRHIKH